MAFCTVDFKFWGDNTRATGCLLDCGIATNQQDADGIVAGGPGPLGPMECKKACCLKRCLESPHVGGSAMVLQTLPDGTAGNEYDCGTLVPLAGGQGA